MLFWAEHGVALVEELQVVIIWILSDELEFSATTPGRAGLLRGASCRTAAAALAAPDAMVLLKPQPVCVNLIDFTDIG
jgi:hypothetical protein